MTILPEQCRAARGMVKMSQKALAEAAGVAKSTVNDFERDVHTPFPGNLTAIRAALEAAGIVFSDGDDTIGPGLHLRDPQKK